MIGRDLLENFRDLESLTAAEKGDFRCNLI